MNLIKMLWCRFGQSFRTFTMLLVEETSEMGFFTDLSDYVFRVHNFLNTKSIYLFIYSLFNVHNYRKNTVYNKNSSKMIIDVNTLVKKKKLNYWT